MVETAIYYLVFCGVCITVLKELNVIVDEPYMDEPFHVPQAQAYCRGEFATWDPKITTPPGLYIMSLFLKRVFMFKCTLPMLRLTTVLALMSLPLVLTHFLCFNKRMRPPTSILSPTMEALILGAFPIAWFFGFLYYTEVPSLVLVVATVVAATDDRHWLAALLGLVSCTFRQTNVIWVLYAYALSQLTYLRFRRASPGAEPPKKLHDPPALAAGPGDLLRSIFSFPAVIADISPSFVPYAFVVAAFGGFIVWNGGVVLGDKANHIPSLHIPQLYYFFAFSTTFGWPVLISGPGGIRGLIWGVSKRMFGGKLRILSTMVLSIAMGVTVKLFTIHHPFLLSDNRHYTFYLWRRVYMFHSTVPYLLIPGYVACGWAWFLRAGRDQTLLQTLILPVFVLPTLLPTPLLEPRYFLIPYILLRSQVSDVPTWALAIEGLWYAAINGVTMGIFLYLPRAGVGRFMW
ncbi:glucosyltransferase [Collybia nuda]|uniref:Dol-P-Glc:Glc(2)Man(9)GlcNAc(2)-PP-Dol alpha-1,2-glucosyltransferase n=1 Tax=Collybia nuda TaxID=64659 RepID=A0A9P5XZ60_9AGAR|nr:glucosyltransferase [Collybia nuda]